MVESYKRMVHNRVADWQQIYLKEGASQLQQRIWLNSLLLKYDQAKEDGISRYITKHVLNIAQYFLDADEIDVPPAHIMAELLSTQRIPNMPRVIQRQFNSYLSARTRELELSSTTLAQMDEAALAQKLRDNLRDKKLSPAIIGSIIKYYQAKISTPHREVWNAAQAQAVSLLIDSIDPKLHTDLKIPTYVGSNAAISLVSLQGSLLIKSLFAYVYPELYPVVEKPTLMPAAVTTEESDSSQCVAHTATVLPPDKLSGDQGTSADSFPHPVNAHSQGLSAVERAAKIRKGKLILDHH